MNDDDDEKTPPRPAHISDIRSSPIVRLLERDVTDEDRALAKRLSRVGGDPQLLAARLIRALEAEKQDSSEQVAEQLGKALEEHDRKLESVAADVTEFKAGIRWGKVLGGFALGIAVSVAGFVVNRMLSGEELKGEYRVRLQHIEERIDWLFNRATSPTRDVP